MKCMIILVVCVAAISAQYIPGEMGIGLGGYGGGYSSGGGYADVGHGAGYQGLHNNGYQSGGMGSNHNIGHVEDDLHQETNHHHAEDHNIGGSIAGGSGGYNSGAYGGYDRGHANRGGGYQSGFSGIRG